MRLVKVGINRKVDVGPTKVKRISVSHFIIYLIAIIMLGGLFIVRASLADPVIFDFVYNPYALISAFSALINLVFLIYLTRTRIRGSEAVWFTLFIATFFLFSVFETFQRLSANPDGAIFWSRLLGIVTLTPLASFMFVLNYLNPRSRHTAVTVVLLLASMLLFFFHANGYVIYNSNTEYYPWGYNNDVGPGFIFHALWIVGLAVTTVTLLIRFILSTANPLLRKQAIFFTCSMAAPFITGVITEIIIPSLSGGKTTVVPLAAATGTVSVAILFWGVKRYHAFQISPALLSHDILTLMTEAVIVTDKNLKIEYVNNESKEKFTEVSKKLEGRLITEFFDKESSEKFQKAVTTLKNDHVVLDDIILVTESDAVVYARLSLSRIAEENGVDGYITVISDVTELKQSYDALEKEKANVEHTVEVRTKELREAQTRLLETDKLKTEFVLLTSHNLRTPLTIIKGNLDLLKLPNVSEEKKNNFLKDAETSAAKLGALVEDLLTISNIEAGDSLVLENTSISEIITPLLTEMETLATNRNNKFEAHIDVGGQHVPANANRLRAGIRNILENASKFTKDGRIILSAGIKGNQLILTVLDNGMGIPAAEIPKLFTKFHRSTDAMHYEYDGEGIGLYLTKLIIEDHGGTITINSIEGKGTQVTMTLPLSPTMSKES